MYILDIQKIQLSKNKKMFHVQQAECLFFDSFSVYVYDILLIKVSEEKLLFLS